MGKSDTTATDFLRALYKPLPGGLVELRAIPLDKGQSVRRAWVTKPSQINAFAKEYGGRDSGYGVYYGVCKRKGEGGTKADVLGASALWCDIDAEINGQKTEDIFQSIGGMPADIQPSAVVHSGGGLHCFWFLDKPNETQKQIEDANKIVMELMGGDACFDTTRILRLPETYNNKRAVKKLCHVLYCADHMRYELDGLIDRMLTFGRVLNGTKWCNPEKIPKAEPLVEGSAPHFFEKYALTGGARSRELLDKMWAERVRDGAPRGYMGVHEATIISAARLYCNSKDYPTIESIISYVKFLQKSAPGVDTSSWDWAAEEKKIRRSLETWGEKWKTLKKVQRGVPK